VRPAVEHRDLVLQGQNFHLQFVPRSPEVLQLIAEGFSSREIVKELSISIKTVDKHRQMLMDTLNLHKVADLSRFFVARDRREHAPDPSRRLVRSNHEL
jgi:DNA-binding NarL/FixJ family response regulator